MIEFFNKLFGRQTSGATAKERLRLVLMSDHLSLAPEMVEAMKRDLVDVISRYVQVDREKIDMHFEQENGGLAMLANIPITGVNRDGGTGSGGGKADEPTQTHEEQKAETPQPVAAEARTAAGSGSSHRRRKRRKGGSGSPAPAT
jgi:cell division topological specificity factor